MSTTVETPVRSGAAPMLVGTVVGVAGALLGLLPWLLTGARLPLQNLWLRPTLPQDMPRALLPINQYYVTTIVALLASGAVVTGLAARAARRHDVSVASAVTAGVLCQVLAVGQSLFVLREGLGLDEAVGLFEPDPADPRAALYWWGMLVGSLLAVVAAALVTVLTSRPSRGPAALGVVLAAVPVGSWLGVWLSTVSGPTGPPTVTGQVVRWVPAIVVAAALGWCGPGSLGRAGVWLVGLAALLCLPPVLTAVTTALGTRSLRGDVEQTVAVMVEVLRAAVGTGVAPALTAAVLAAVLTVALRPEAGDRPDAQDPSRGDDRSQGGDRAGQGEAT